jgi:uncharacterized membrane protein YidH (DUF202 family)
MVSDGSELSAGHVESVIRRNATMRSTGMVVAGVVIALLGLVFTLQGVGALKGSTMSNTTFWSVAGPVIIIVGLAMAGIGYRRRTR